MIHIQEPFWSAGKQYGWPYKSPGLGIDLRELAGEGNLSVIVGKDKDTIWTMDKLRARKLTETHQSYFQAKSIRLAVLPWDQFEKSKEPELPSQKKLF